VEYLARKKKIKKEGIMNNNELKNITITMVFDGSALNRDEKVGGNILSIKKLNVNGEIRSFIGKPAIRHYLFQTLWRAFGWEPAQVTGQGEVVQLDLTKSDILTSAELDVFGYMFTRGKTAVTRKSPLGITKAVALFPYSGDLAFYANHDLVRRGKEDGLAVTPNPFTKEEHAAFYKVSFTLDTGILGNDMWVVEDTTYDEQANMLRVSIVAPVSVALDNVERRTDEHENVFYEMPKGRIFVDGRTVKVDEQLMQKKPAKKNLEEHLVFSDKGRSKFRIFDFSYDDDSKQYEFDVDEEPEYDESKKALTLKIGAVKEIPCVKLSGAPDGKETYAVSQDGKELGTLVVERKEQGPCIVRFSLAKQQVEQRFREVVSALVSGLYAQSSGEANTIIPLFLVAAPVKVPSPVFHPYIDVRKEDGQWKVIGVKDALKNSWIDGKVYVFDCERLKVFETDEELKELSDGKVTRDWNELLKDIGITGT